MWGWRDGRSGRLCRRALFAVWDDVGLSSLVKHPAVRNRCRVGSHGAYTVLVTVCSFWWWNHHHHHHNHYHHHDRHAAKFWSGRVWSSRQPGEYPSIEHDIKWERWRNFTEGGVRREVERIGWRKNRTAGKKRDTKNFRGRLVGKEETRRFVQREIERERKRKRDRRQPQATATTTTTTPTTTWDTYNARQHDANSVRHKKSRLVYRRREGDGRKINRQRRKRWTAKFRFISFLLLS